MSKITARLARLEKLIPLPPTYWVITLEQRRADNAAGLSIEEKIQRDILAWPDDEERIRRYYETVRRRVRQVEELDDAEEWV